MEAIWTEKYRPKRLDDVAGQEQNTQRLKAFVDKQSLPHCIFAGPAGTGKTTSALAIAYELFGDKWRNNFLEMNASNERGINTIRTKVKDFARTMPIGGSDFKVIYMDEADSLTPDAQQALRRTMERYSKTCRFILACNWSSKLIPPIQSRTAIFRFPPIRKDILIKHLKKIAADENIDIDDEGLDTIAYIAEGDLRQGINILQTAATMDKSIGKEEILKVTSSADPENVNKMLKKCVNGDFNGARKRLMDMLMKQGLSGEDIIKEIHKQVLKLDIDDEKKVKLLERTGEYEFRLTEGATPLIQLEALIAQFVLIKPE